MSGTLISFILGRERYGIAPQVLGLAEASRASGAELYTISVGPGPLVDELRARGHQVHELNLAVPDQFDGGLIERLRNGVRLWSWDKEAFSRSQSVLPNLGRIEGVYVAWPTLLGLACRVARAANIRVLWEMPGIVSRSRASRMWYHYHALRYPLTIAGASFVAADSLRAWPSRAVRSPLGVYHEPESCIDVEAERARLGAAKSDVVVGVFARVIPTKGQEVLLQALAGSPADVRDSVVICIVGSGDEAYISKLRAFGRSAGVRICTTGYITNPSRLYHACDLVVNMQIYPPEPFGLSVIDAMIRGKPVLCHATGGPSETVVDGETGWHVDEASPLAVCRGLLRALADRERWAEMGANGARRAREHYSHSAHHNRVRALLAGGDGSRESYMADLVRTSADEGQG